MNDWIDIRDKLPENGISCLVARPGHMVVARYEAGRWRTHWDSCILQNVTHWQPLPDLPSPPRPKRPFEGRRGTRGIFVLTCQDHSLILLGLEANFGEDLVNWLNEMWIKDE